jgi:hypothetical protein
MKKSLQIMLMAVAFMLASGISNEVSAQQEAPIVGGYGEASTTDRQVISAAKFAVRREQRKKGVRLSLVSIERAETQVVAGRNYRLCLRVKSKGQTKDVTAVVYQNLKPKYSLTSWEDGCQSAKSPAPGGNAGQNPAP